HDVYADFGFSDVRVVIATRPAERLGSDEIWDKSEQALEAAVKHRELPYELAHGEGAFYGPKIEFHLKDALGRPWQLGTIQVDTSADKLGAKIRNARGMRLPYLAVVGQREAEQRGVALRSRDEDKDLGFMPLDAVIERIRVEGMPPSRRKG